MKKGELMKKAIKVLTVITPVFLVLAIAAGAVLFFSPFGLQAMKSATGGYGSFDMRFSYTPDAIMTILSHFEGDRMEIFSRYFMLDYIFLALYSVVMFSLPLLIYLRDDKHYLLFRSAMFSAVAHAVFDVIENLMLMRMVETTPMFTDGEANLCSGITVLKWAFLGIWVLSIVMLMIFTLLDSMKDRN